MLEDDARKKFVRGAFLFALALIFQGMRSFVPMPPFIGMFLIGSFVNLTLILAVQQAGLLPSILMGFLLPTVAFMQGQLAIAVLIPVVAMGNLILVLWMHFFQEKMIVWLAPLLKTLVLYSGCRVMIQAFAIPREVASIMLLIMGWPQIITAVAGILLARQISRRVFVQGRNNN